MRDLREAAREGRQAFLRSLAGFPHRHPFWIAGSVFGIAAVLGILGYYNTSRKVTHVDQSVTRIEAATPCLTYGRKSEACKEAFEQAVLTITHAEACAIERKAGTLRAIRELADALGIHFAEPCAHARLRQERRRGKERAATRATKGVMPSTGNSPHSQPGPHHGGSGNSGGGGKGGSDSPSVPGEGGSPGAPAPGPGAPQNPPAPSPPAGSPGNSQQRGAPATVEATGKAAGDVVEARGGAAQGTVEGVGKTGDCVLRGC